MNTYSEKFDLTKKAKLHELFKSKSCTFSDQAHACFNAKNKDFTAILYNSGKLVIQGQDIAGIASEVSSLFNIKPTTIISKKQTESRQINIPTKHIGTDESGKGDYFGPLIVAGVLVDEKTDPILKALGIKDSKKLDDETILKLAVAIQAKCPHSIVTINPEKYNELYDKFKNLNRLLAWAHSRAIENILQKHDCDFVLSDKFGNERLIQNALMDKGKTIKLEQMVRAESDIAVAAASILARSEFVKKMQELADYYKTPLHKGASDIVISDAITFCKKHSYEQLHKVAKLHFKTTLTVKSQMN